MSLTRSRILPSGALLWTPGSQRRKFRRMIRLFSASTGGAFGPFRRVNRLDQWVRRPVGRLFQRPALSPMTPNLTTFAFIFLGEPKRACI